MTNLEEFACRLQDFLEDTEVTELNDNCWELWQIQTLSQKQGNNGFLLVFRRAK